MENIEKTIFEKKIEINSIIMILLFKGKYYFEEKLDYFSKVERKMLLKETFPKLKNFQHRSPHMSCLLFCLWGGSIKF